MATQVDKDRPIPDTKIFDCTESRLPAMLNGEAIRLDGAIRVALRRSSSPKS